MFWKNFSKVSDKHKRQPSRGVLSKDVLKKFLKFTEKASLSESPFLKKMHAGNLKLAEAAAGDAKQDLLKNFENFTGKYRWWSLFLIKLEYWGPANLLKKTPTQVFSCEFCKLFKSTCFLEDLKTACFQTPVRGSFFKKVASLTAWKL